VLNVTKSHLVATFYGQLYLAVDTVAHRQMLFEVDTELQPERLRVFRYRVYGDDGEIPEVPDRRLIQLAALAELS